MEKERNKSVEVGGSIRFFHVSIIQLVLGRLQIPRGIENNAYAKLLGGKRGVLLEQ